MHAKNVIKIALNVNINSIIVHHVWQDIIFIIIPARFNVQFKASTKIKNIIYAQIAIKVAKPAQKILIKIVHLAHQIDI